jgi:hypothetical protein
MTLQLHLYALATACSVPITQLLLLLLLIPVLLLLLLINHHCEHTTIV